MISSTRSCIIWRRIFDACELLYETLQFLYNRIIMLISADFITLLLLRKDGTEDRSRLGSTAKEELFEKL